MKRERTSSLPLHQVTHNLQYKGPDVGSWHRNQITPISDYWAVAGPDRDLVIRELSRLRKSAGQQKRRQLALLGATATLVIIGATVWLIVESVNAFTSTSISSDLQRWIFALIEIILWAISLVCATVVLYFFRSRKPSSVSMFMQIVALIACAFHLILAVLDFILIGVWRRQVSNQCDSWRVDVVWMDRRTCVGQGTSMTGFFIAAAIRLLVVVIVSALWISLLRIFAKSLERQTEDRVIDIDLVQSSEVQQILDRHTAQIIPVKPNEVMHSVTANDESDLPPMPEHRRLLDRSQVGEEEEKAPARSGWLWTAAAWLFGVGGEETHADQSHVTDPEKQTVPERPSTPTITPAISQNYRGTPSPARFQQFSKDVNGQTDDESESARRDPSPDSYYARLFGFGGRDTPAAVQPSREANPSPPQISHESQDTLHPSSKNPLDVINQPLVSPYEQSYEANNRTEEQLNPTASFDYSSWPGYNRSEDRLSPAGTQGLQEPPRDRQMIYVQMGDGQLVHRLSTIGELTTTGGDRSTIMDSENGSLHSAPSSEEPQLPGALPPSRGSDY